jgi:hypothetical protein
MKQTRRCSCALRNMCFVRTTSFFYNPHIELYIESSNAVKSKWRSPERGGGERADSYETQQLVPFNKQLLSDARNYCCVLDSNESHNSSTTTLIHFNRNMAPFEPVINSFDYYSFRITPKVIFTSQKSFKRGYSFCRKLKLACETVFSLKGKSVIIHVV